MTVGSGDTTDVEVTTFGLVSAGDTVTLEAYQSSGGNLDMDAAYFNIIRLFPAD